MCFGLPWLAALLAGVGFGLALRGTARRARVTLDDILRAGIRAFYTAGGVLRVREATPLATTLRVRQRQPGPLPPASLPAAGLVLTPRLSWEVRPYREGDHRPAGRASTGR